MKKIVIFASGSGSNALNIALHFKNNSLATVVGILTNNPDAKVIQKAKNSTIPSFVFSKKELNEGNVLQLIDSLEADFIILAGFLLKFPENIISKFPNKILNIHPSLLPKYGGKGMYGKFVHEAVLENKEQESGITIHFVNEKYDDGAIIFQKSVSIVDCKNSDDIAEQIQILEHKYFPEIIEQEIKKLF